MAIAATRNPTPNEDRVVPLFRIKIDILLRTDTLSAAIAHIGELSTFHTNRLATFVTTQQGLCIGMIGTIKDRCFCHAIPTFQQLHSYLQIDHAVGLKTVNYSPSTAGKQLSFPNEAHGIIPISLWLLIAALICKSSISCFHETYLHRSFIDLFCKEFSGKTVTPLAINESLTQPSSLAA
ncbi:MAG: hypothetical protein R2867_35555 [Caldilineaceae bacterium]